MGSITSEQPKIQVSVSDLEQELQRSQEREQFLRLRIEELERERDYLKRLFANPHLSAAMKLVMWAIRSFVLSVRYDPHSQIDIHIGGKNGLAAATGISTDTVGRTVKSFDNMGALVRSERPDWTEDANGRPQKHTVVSVALTELADHPEAIQPEESRNHGGKRVKRCEACGSDDIVVEKHVYCRNCELTLHHTIEPLNKPDPEPLDSLPQNDFQVEDVEASTVESCDDPEPTEPITEPQLEVVTVESPLSSTLARLADWDEGHGPKPSGACWDCGTKNVYHWNYLNEQWACGWCHALTGRGAISS